MTNGSSDETRQKIRNKGEEIQELKICHCNPSIDATQKRVQDDAADGADAVVHLSCHATFTIVRIDQ